jgi:hypothetical protein
VSQQPRASKWATMAVVASGVFMATLDASIVNVSLPIFIDELDAPFVAVQWVVLGYLLVITGMLLPAGRASEILGRKRLFLWGFAVFTLGSLTGRIRGQCVDAGGVPHRAGAGRRGHAGDQPGTGAGGISGP